MTALDSRVVTLHLLGNEIVCLEDGLLGRGVELIPGSECG